jgi:hypothetical protein
MSSHPGSTLDDAIELALYTKRIGLAPEQVQDFYPTPGTASTVMYYTGLDPFTMKKIYTPTDYGEKRLQRSLLQYRRPENRALIREGLTKAGREEALRELLGSASHSGSAKTGVRTEPRQDKYNNRKKDASKRKPGNGKSPRPEASPKKDVRGPMRKKK